MLKKLLQFLKALFRRTATTAETSKIAVTVTTKRKRKYPKNRKSAYGRKKSCYTLVNPHGDVVLENATFKEISAYINAEMASKRWVNPAFKLLRWWDIRNAVSKGFKSNFANYMEYGWHVEK